MSNCNLTILLTIKQNNMEFSTKVEVKTSDWLIGPCERMLFVGSCFADNMGQRFIADKFRAKVNPYGVMYNPASILHTVKRLTDEQSMPFEANEQGTAVFTLGTNHVYILKETEEIVDNCNKRPQQLFREQELTVDECTDYIEQTITLIHKQFPKVRFILTVSPIRYRKYGYHGSQLSKATLLLAVDKVIKKCCDELPQLKVAYFPSYEIINDELRDYRFYKPDMLHPTAQAIDYIYEKFNQAYFSEDAFSFLRLWEPIREAMGHRPLHPESEAYQQFKKQTSEKLEALKASYPMMEV